MIEARGLTKRYGTHVAVDRLSFDVLPGVVTGFLGPNGAGKSTTMRMVLGLDLPDSGTALVNGVPYASHPAPLHEVGALLEAQALHPRRSVRNHLLSLALTTGIPTSRVDEVLDLVGLSEVGSRTAGGLSLGMAQRLGVAGALLGDPPTLLLDEPGNGLDPQGIRWIRTLLRSLAAEGRTVLVSSHVMTEMALTADHLLVIGRGRLVADVSVEELTRSAVSSIRVRADDPERLCGFLARSSAEVSRDGEVLEVHGLSSEQVGRLALEAQVALFELTPVHTSLEDAFMSLTDDLVEYRAGERAEGAR